jgi:2-dehydropantoate 2-reductase
VRKRKTEVDAQIGPIVETGAAKGIPTPLTSRLITLIHDIEDGRRPLAWSTLDVLQEAMPKGAMAQ